MQVTVTRQDTSIAFDPPTVRSVPTGRQVHANYFNQSRNKDVAGHTPSPFAAEHNYSLRTY